MFATSSTSQSSRTSTTWRHCSLTRRGPIAIVEAMGRWGNARGLFVFLVVGACGFPRPADVGPDDAMAGPAYQLLAVTPAIATAGDADRKSTRLNSSHRT